MKYWLMKSEPGSFAIQDLADRPDQTTCWDGVRNYQARNFMREMRVGDRVLFYHSSADPTAIVGTAVVVREAYPDHTAWERGNDHFDAKASPENPIWEMVDIRLDEIFPRPLPLAELHKVKSLAGMELLRKGSRLSVQSVKAKEFETVLSLARKKSEE
jgi:predicted RNA-binding protein with PUA-like domain